MADCMALLCYFVLVCMCDQLVTLRLSFVVDLVNASHSVIVVTVSATARMAVMSSTAVRFFILLYLFHKPEIHSVDTEFTQY